MRGRRRRKKKKKKKKKRGKKIGIKRFAEASVFNKK